MTTLKYATLRIFILIITASFFWRCTPQETDQEPVPKIIFDTDFGGDADDLGALAMLNHFQNRQESDLLAVMCWNTEPYSVAAVSAVNTFYSNGSIPIGTRKPTGDPVSWNHSKVIADHFPYKVDASSAPDATQLYREILAGQPDSEVIIVTVGPLYNIMALINSEPDEHSPLAGGELIRSKVKEFVIMGGQFPSGEQEWNFDGDMPGVTMYVIENLDVPVTFSGYEIGVDIKSGEVFNQLDQAHPLYKGFMHFSEFCPWLNEQWKGEIYDNSTYDQTAVLYAVRGGVGEYWEKVIGGKCLPDSTGGNTWVQADQSRHSYLKLLKGHEEMAQLIEGMMLGDF